VQQTTRSVAPEFVVRPGQIPNRNASESQQWQQYGQLVQRAHGQWPPTGGRPVVVGVRSVDRVNGRYGDTFTVLTADQHVQHYDGATHPSNANRGQRGGTGMVVPGNYAVSPNRIPDERERVRAAAAHGRGDPLPGGLYGPHADGSYEARRQDGSSPLGWRDRDLNGTFSDAERQRANGIGGVLFHSGGRDNSGSWGCQTMPPDDYHRFQQAMGRQNFDYTLLHVDRSAQ